MAEGHRQRLKNRFLNYGLESFEPHNVIELMLFYTIPRKDTNGLAHDLIDRFGSFNAVLEADYESLMEVKGITAHSASLIKLFLETIKYYERGEKPVARTFYNTNEIGHYLAGVFTGFVNEQLYIMYLDNKNRVIYCANSFGGPSSSTAYTLTNSIVDDATARHASGIVLAHNHPKGTYIPSTDDIRFTNIIHGAVHEAGMNFIEHYIIADGKYNALLSRTIGS